MMLTWVLVRGVKESAGTNTTMVLIKIVAIIVFCLGAARSDQHRATGIHSCPTDSPGVLTGAAIVFFTYIGFDSVSTAAEECQSAARSAVRHHHDANRLHGALPRVSLVLTGIAPWKTLNNAAPVAEH